MTTLDAAFPVEAATKWDWVWKALVFADVPAADAAHAAAGSRRRR